ARGARRPRGLHRDVCRVTSFRPGLPGRRSPEPPARTRAHLSRADLGARATVRATVRRADRWHGRAVGVGGAGPRELVPGPTRRSALLVSLPPPLWPDAAACARAARRRY